MQTATRTLLAALTLAACGSDPSVETGETGETDTAPEPEREPAPLAELSSDDCPDLSESGIRTFLSSGEERTVSLVIPSEPTENMPVVFIAPHDSVYQKVLANMQEVKARGGRMIAITTAGNGGLAGIVDHELRVPRTPALLSPFLTSVPLQLLAYHIAVRRGCDVDKPRNLAKSVTVE